MSQPDPTSTPTEAAAAELRDAVTAERDAYNQLIAAQQRRIAAQDACAKLAQQGPK